jgi:hypothetical protein
MAESKIVEATGTAAAGEKANAKLIEEAMAEAVRQAMANGITDPEEIRRLQLEARAKLKSA